MTTHLDPHIHSTQRLQICAMIDSATTVEFSAVRAALGVSASSLSKQLSALAAAGYIRQDRAVHDSRRQWLSLTPEGRRAYRAHVAALRAIIGNGSGG